MTWEAVDILDRSSVVDAVARLRPAVVYHCAGAAHVGQAWDSTVATFATNVRGTDHVIEGLLRAGSGVRMLVPSSALVYRPASEALAEDHPLAPTGPYGVSKLAQELLGSHTSTSIVQIMIARAFNHLARGSIPISRPPDSRDRLWR